MVLARDEPLDDARRDPPDAVGVAPLMAEGELVDVGLRVLGATALACVPKSQRFRNEIVEWQTCYASLSRRWAFVWTTLSQGRSSRL